MIRKIVQALAFAVAVLVIASTMALAEEMMCSQDDGKNCTMAKDASGQETEVMVPSAKIGDKLNCTEKDDMMICKKDVMMKK